MNALYERGWRIVQDQDDDEHPAGAVRGFDGPAPVRERVVAKLRARCCRHRRRWSLDDAIELAAALAPLGELGPAVAWRSLGLARSLLRRGPVPNWLRALVMHRRLQGARR